MKIACVLADDFEDSELRIPLDRLRDAGVTVEVIGANKGEELVGKRGKERVRVALAIDDVSVEDYDGLLIPGGYSPDRLRQDERFVELARAFALADKLVAAVCHGPQLLVTADVVRGRRMTAWRTVQKELEEAGADVVDEPVVIDRNFITSRQPADLEAFSAAILRHLGAGPEAPGQAP